VYPSGLEPANIGLIRSIIDNIKMDKGWAFEARIYEYTGNQEYKTYLSFK
jgi:hypothetical protein